MDKIILEYDGKVTRSINFNRDNFELVDLTLSKLAAINYIDVEDLLDSDFIPEPFNITISFEFEGMTMKTHTDGFEEDTLKSVLYLFKKE
ncbi:MAG: hypothetical protein RR623_07570 [Bacilli bacterium]